MSENIAKIVAVGWEIIGVTVKLSLGGAIAVVLLLSVLASLAYWVVRKYRASSAETTTTLDSNRTTMFANPVVRQFRTVLLVVAGLWIVGSLVNQRIDNPMPYTIALALGALQYFTGSKRGNVRSAVVLTLLAAAVIWFWIHPHVLWGIGSSIIEPLGTSETVQSWEKSDVSLALNVIMLIIIVRALWWTGDFYGMVFQVGVMVVGRMLFGI